MAEEEKGDQSIASGIDTAIKAAHVKSPASEELLKRKSVVRGYDFDQGLNHHELLKSFISCGFQSTLFARAIKEVNIMVNLYVK